MKPRISSLITLRSFVVAATIAIIPQMAYANDDSAEIARLKAQLAACKHHHHRRHHASSCSVREAHVVERTKIIEKPVIVEKERIIEKEVQAPAVVEEQTQTVVENAQDNAVVVEHAKTRK